MAVYSERYNYIFFANPNTASTAITKTLLERLDGRQLHHKLNAEERANSRKLQHMTPADVVKAGLVTREALEGACTAAGVRNPFDLLVSRYLKRRTMDLVNQKAKMISRPGKEKFVKNVGIAADALFPEWIKAVMGDRPDDKTQLKYTGFVDCIIRFENLQEDFLEFQRVAKIPHPVEAMTFNVSKQRLGDGEKKRPYTDFYDDESRATVARVFASTIERFGYRFGE